MLSEGSTTELNEIGGEILINSGSSETGVGGADVLSGRLSRSNDRGAVSITAG